MILIWEALRNSVWGKGSVWRAMTYFEKAILLWACNENACKAQSHEDHTESSAELSHSCRLDGHETDG